jgi:hypothetical protein
MPEEGKYLEGHEIRIFMKLNRGKQRKKEAYKQN